MAWGSISHERRRELLEAGRERGRRQLEQMRAQKGRERTEEDTTTDDPIQRL